MSQGKLETLNGRYAVIDNDISVVVDFIELAHLLGHEVDDYCEGSIKGKRKRNPIGEYGVDVYMNKTGIWSNPGSMMGQRISISQVRSTLKHLKAKDQAYPNQQPTQTS